MQDINVPIIGSRGLMTLVSLAHILLVSIAGTGPLVAYVIEGVGSRRGDERHKRVAKALVTSVLELAVVGGILGSGVVVVLVGLYPPAITMLANIFFWFLVLQLVCFIAGLAFLFAYYYTFGKPDSRHRIWGLVAAILPLIVKVVFSAGVGFTNNPGSWPESGSIWAAVFNPMTVPMLLHRLLAGVSLVGFFIVGYALWRARRAKEEEEHSYARFTLQLGVRLALWSTIAQIIPGLLILFVGLPPEGRAAVLGTLLLPWVLALVLGLVALLLLYLFAGRPEKGPYGSPLLWLAVICIVVTTGLMGYVRSQARGSDMMFRVLDEEGELQEVPEVYLQPPVSGEAVFKANCSACHPGLAGDAVSKARSRHPDPADLVGFLRDPGATAGVAMPPFSGSEEELSVLLSYLLGPEAGEWSRRRQRSPR